MIFFLSILLLNFFNSFFFCLLSFRRRKIKILRDRTEGRLYICTYIHIYIHMASHYWTINEPVHPRQIRIGIRDRAVLKPITVRAIRRTLTANAFIECAEPPNGLGVINHRSQRCIVDLKRVNVEILHLNFNYLLYLQENMKEWTLK